MKSKLPTEVEVIYELMPCNAMRVAQEPGPAPHPCAYFRKWGSYHSFDYREEGPPPGADFDVPSVYVGRAPLLPEPLSGCRKAPILAVGINPNLPGWYRQNRRALNPHFDDYKQYARYFRYRALAKPALPADDYERYGGGAHDDPFSGFELDVPEDEEGGRPIRVEQQRQSMYRGYQALLDRLGELAGWEGHGLAVGEDLAYGNMVACPSSRWTTRPLEGSPDDEAVPPMTTAERDGIVTECFRERRYFLRQLFQSLPAVLLVFSQSTANALIGELADLFVEGGAAPGMSLAELGQGRHRLRYGDLPDGRELTARVIFAPHITGTPEAFSAARDRVVEQLLEEVEAGRLRYDAARGHLGRPVGACSFCPTFELDPCGYELDPVVVKTELLADGVAQADPIAEKRWQQGMLDQVRTAAAPAAAVWPDTDEEDGPGQSL